MSAALRDALVDKLFTLVAYNVDSNLVLSINTDGTSPNMGARVT